MKLHIIRHADPDYANRTITATGHLEAKALAVRMKSLSIDRIYSSPLGRALDTMWYTAKLLELPFTVEDWTREFPDSTIHLPPWRRMAAWDIPGEVHFSSDYTHSILDQPNIADYVATVRRDSDEFLARHGYERDGQRYRVVTPSTEQIAVFCHQGFGLTWLAHLLNLPVDLVWSSFWIAPSSVTTVLLEERPVVAPPPPTLLKRVQRWMRRLRDQPQTTALELPAYTIGDRWAVPRCLNLGDVSHLYAAGLSPQPRGLKGNLE